MGQMAVCCQNLTLGALSSSSALNMLVGALFKMFGFFLNTPHTLSFFSREIYSLNKVNKMSMCCVFAREVVHFESSSSISPVLCREYAMKQSIPNIY
jgi:hypothetical protein